MICDITATRAHLDSAYPRVALRGVLLFGGSADDARNWLSFSGAKDQPVLYADGSCILTGTYNKNGNWCQAFIATENSSNTKGRFSRLGMDVPGQVPVFSTYCSDPQ
ncbi:hypothetical protein V5799_014652 [Amblyomma americanum]|uniref:Uncharacterized protein n=1 Tax=Amblyomma americanum TaxID=6943 RepID=A0AAQ4E2E2_AMBAM